MRKAVLVMARETTYHDTKLVSAPTVPTTQWKTFNWFLWEQGTVYHQRYALNFDLSQTCRFRDTTVKLSITIQKIHRYLPWWFCIDKYITLILFACLFVFKPSALKRKISAKLYLVTFNNSWELINVSLQLHSHLLALSFLHPSPRIYRD